LEKYIQLWVDTPRWIRGIFLGNLSYLLIIWFAYLIAWWKIDKLNVIGWIATVFLIPTIGLYLQCISHIVWCTLGAIFVGIFGEIKGILLLLVTVIGVGSLILGYAVTHFIQIL
jgi:hypothetical protein